MKPVKDDYFIKAITVDIFHDDVIQDTAVIGPLCSNQASGLSVGVLPREHREQVTICGQEARPQAKAPPGIAFTRRRRKGFDLWTDYSSGWSVSSSICSTGEAPPVQLLIDRFF